MEVPYFSGYFRSRWYFEADGKTLEQSEKVVRDLSEFDDGEKINGSFARGKYADNIDPELGAKYFDDGKTNRSNTYKVCNDADYATYLESGYGSKPPGMFARAPRSPGMMMEGGLQYVLDAGFRSGTVKAATKTRKAVEGIGWADRVMALEKSKFPKNYTDFV